VAVDPVFASRLTRLPLLDNNDQEIGRVSDLVLVPPVGGQPPRAIGLIASVQRRRIFVNIGRVADVSIAGVRMRSGTVDLRHFELRSGEMLASDLFNKMVGGAAVLDLALLATTDRAQGWDITGVALGSSRSLRRRVHKVVDWEECSELFAAAPGATQLATLRSLHPTDLAHAVEAMTPARRRLLTEAMADEELADVLEEMSESDQVRVLEGIDPQRVADVIEEMDQDDAADLLAEMPAGQRNVVLDLMDDDTASSIRRLLRYDATTAGGLMTPQPIVLPPEASVAEALARIRNPDLPPATAAQVFVCEPPTTTPTGHYLGVVGFQRLLREAPSVGVGECIQDSSYVRSNLTEDQVAGRLAAYDLVSVAVCDEAERLVGAVTVDDVMDSILPEGWRRRRR
jgi:CBS domain-containing protein